MKEEPVAHKDRFSRWTLEELDRWNRQGLTPIHPSQDTEYLCAFFGALDVLSWFGPEVLTLVHGSSGCGLSHGGMRPCSSNSPQRHSRPHSTNLGPQHVVFGGQDRLIEALEDVDRRLKPKVIVVITNCCSYMIGEDVKGTVASVAPRLEADVLALEVAGCDGTGFRKGADKALDLLFGYLASRHPAPPPVEGERPTINLFTKRVSGLPAEEGDVNELRRLLDKIGVGVNAVVRAGMPFEDLLALPRARANACLCFTFGKGPMESLQRLHSQPFVPMIFPLGLQATLAWVEQVANLLGVPDRLPQDPDVERASATIERLRARVGGRLAYIWQPGVKGLATALFAAELGMKPVLFGMSYYLEEHLRPTVEILLARGFNPDLVMVGKYGLLEDAAAQPEDVRPLIFMPKKFWLGDGCPNVTFNFFSDSLMGLRGIDTLAAEVEDALAMVGHRDYRLFNRYIETVYKTTDWKVARKDTIAGVDSEDLKWKRWNQI
jgi:nitrogenase molybdenum-iron protein alpha/beta subunit